MKDSAAAAAVEAYYAMVNALPDDVRLRARLDPDFPERCSRAYEAIHGELPSADVMVQRIAAHTYNLDARLADARAQIKAEKIAKAQEMRRLEKARGEAEDRALTERIERAEAERDRREAEEHAAFVADVAKQVATVLPQPAPAPVEKAAEPDRGPARKHVCRDKATGLIAYVITEWPQSADPQNMLMTRPIRDEHGDIKSVVEEYFEAVE